MGLSPELFKRLSRLNRRLLRDGVTTGDRLQTQRDDSAAAAPDAAPDGPPLTLETVMPGEERRSERGRCYRITRCAETFWPARTPEGPEAGEGFDAEGFLAAYRRAFFGAGRTVLPEDLHDSLRPLLDADPAGVVYLDIETCGLAGEPLFLVGLMRCAGPAEAPSDGGQARLRIDQFLARDYAEEGPMLAEIWRELAPSRCLVTFNGKSFDLPTLEARSAACGLFDRPSVPDHVDLLHEARRRWRRELPNCRLQTVEQLICARRRVGDIPGCDIPAAYHEFVRSHRSDDPVRRTASVRRLQTILHHNALDLLTMAEVAARIVCGTA